jgi:hypothetical protein
MASTGGHDEAPRPKLIRHSHHDHGAPGEALQPDEAAHIGQREAHGAARRERARLLCLLHDGRAGRDAAAEVTDTGAPARSVEFITITG